MTKLRTRLAAFLHRKDCLYSQLVKYALCGGISVAVDQITFYLLAWLAFPALRLTDPVARLISAMGFTVQEVSEPQLKTNFWIIKIFCFILSNSVVYVLNILFVFRSGKHSRGIEMIMFFGFSLLQFVYIWMSIVLISKYGWEVTYANISMLLVGIASTYFIRKKIIFKG
jgi:putative flippase GtrA